MPFILAAWGLSKATNSLKNLNRYIPTVEKISAVLLIAIGLLLLFGSLSELKPIFCQFTSRGPV